MGERGSRLKRGIRALVTALFVLIPIVLCSQQLTAQPYGPDVYKQRAKAIKAIIDEIDDLISADSSDASLYLRRANLYQQLYTLTKEGDGRRIGSYAENGLADYSRVIELNPTLEAFAARAAFHRLIWQEDQPPGWLTKERVTLFLGSPHFEAAVSDYLKALSLSTDDAHKIEYLWALSDLHQTRALRLSEPPEMQELRARGETYSVWDDFDKAIEYAKKAGEYERGKKTPLAEAHKSVMANLYESKGEAAYKLGEFDVAIDAYSAGENYIPEAYHAVCTYYGGWGDSYAKKKMYDAAIEKYDAAVKISEANCSYLIDRRGDAYAAEGDLVSALSDYTSRIEDPQGIMSNKGVLSIKRAKIYLKLGEAEKALADLDYAIDKAYIVTCPQAYLLRARAYRRLGKADLAVADEDKANKLSRMPESSSTCPENGNNIVGSP